MNASQDLSKWLNFGAGAGIEVAPDRLTVTIAKVRPSGATPIATHQIEKYKERPASEWGAEYQAFLKQHSASHMAAMVILPRPEYILRVLALPGVKDKDLANAVTFQLDGLHPYPDEDVAASFARLGQTSSVLVAIARRETINYYTTLFAEAGIALAGLMPSAASLWSQRRILESPEANAPVLYWAPRGEALEVYGESEARPVYSILFEGAGLDQAARVKAHSLAELRLEDAEPRALPELSYTAAVVSAISRRALAVNLLPADQRVSHSRWWMIPTLALLAVIGMLSVVLWKQPEYQDRQLLKRLEDEIARVEPDARRAQQLEQQISAAKARAAQLDEFRTRTPQDLETLLELTRVLPPPAWINTLDLTRTLVNLGGESPQADNLLSQLDNSPRFKESYYTAPLARGQGAELFRIRSTREIPTDAPPTAPAAPSAPPAKPAPGAAQ